MTRYASIVDQWLEIAVSDLVNASSGVNSADLDYPLLLGKDCRYPWDIDAAFALFAAMINRIRTMPVVLTLTLSLRYSEELVTAAPDLTRIGDDLHTSTPPSFHISLPCALVTPLLPMEEYSISVATAHKALSADVRGRYACLRETPADPPGEWYRMLEFTHWSSVARDALAIEMNSARHALRRPRLE